MISSTHSKTSKARGLSDSQFGLILAIPALFVFSMVVLYPFLNSLIMGFFRRSLLSPNQTFIGLGNFERVFADPNLPKVVWNTVVFVLGSTTASLVLGFTWALLLNQGYRGSGFLRGLTLVAWIIPGTAIGFLWMWITHGQYGVLNLVLRELGVTTRNINFLGTPSGAMISVIVARTWQVMPWYMMLLLGGLQTIPFEQIEAARLDGASNWAVLREVILPGMQKVLGLTVLVGIIGNLQHFDIIWVMTQGGPARSTTTFSVEVYRRAFQDFDLGRAAAIGVLWSLMLSTFIVIDLRNRSRQE